MASRNGMPVATARDRGVRVRGDSQQLRDIQDLIARLDDVNRRLAQPARVMSAGRAREADSVELPSPTAG